MKEKRKCIVKITTGSTALDNILGGAFIYDSSIYASL
jgi:RecA/RadA recombinase